MRPGRIDIDRPIEMLPVPLPLDKAVPRRGTLVAINVGGCLIPLSFSLYLPMHSALGMAEVSIAVTAVTCVASVLLGADIFRLRDIRAMGAPVASIGGAGTFDGIFIAGLFAVLLT